MANSILLTLMSLMLASCLSIININLVSAAQGINNNNFFNKSNCLYSYLEDGHYLITFPESEPQLGPLKGLQYDSDKSSCIDLQHHAAQLTMTFNIDDDNMDRMSLNFIINESTSKGYWEINKATLNIVPRNKALFPNDVIELKAVDIYASLKHSYSCNALVLENRTSIDKPNFRLTLKRFQVQPFTSVDVFVPSYDCAVWLTSPVLMGMILILFITFTVMIGVYLLLELGNQSSDLKFSKQGGMLMNQAQLDATKG